MLVPASYEPTVLEYLDKFVVEPINYLLILSMLEEVHIGYWALALETCSNQLCAITKFVFWKLEVTFSGSRAIAERCRCGSE